MFEPLTNTVTIEDLRRMREEGKSNTEIAKSLGVSYSVILKYLGPGGERKERRKTTEEELQAAFSMRQAGMTWPEIAEKTGISEKMLYYHAKKRGITTGKASPHAARIPVTKKTVEKTEEPAACLIVQNKSIELHGLRGSYFIDCKGKEIIAELFKDDGSKDVISIPFDGLDDQIEKNNEQIRRINDQSNELLAIKRKIKDLGVGGEMW